MWVKCPPFFLQKNCIISSESRSTHRPASHWQSECGESKTETCLTSSVRHSQNKRHTLNKRPTHVTTKPLKITKKKKSFFCEHSFASQQQSSQSVSSCIRCPWKIKAVLIWVFPTHPAQFITLIRQGDMSPTINDVPSITMPSSPRFLELIKNRLHLTHQLAHV